MHLLSTTLAEANAFNNATRDKALSRPLASVLTVSFHIAESAALTWRASMHVIL